MDNSYQLERELELHAFGVDDVACAFLALRQIVFFVWVILNEHKWVILGECRGWMPMLRPFSP